MTPESAKLAGVVQLALCTADVARTIRTFVEVLGFSNAGGRPRWGSHAARVQELPTGDNTYVLLWWLIGRQDFVQIELFHHTSPVQRPKRADWKPSDLGWVRFGVMVPDFDDTTRRLREAGYNTETDPVAVNGSRRVCFREPGADTIIEIMEEDSTLSTLVGGPSFDEPAVAYISVSVTDLSRARQYFSEVFGFLEIDPDTLHRPEHEGLWGLAGARRSCAVFRAGEVLLEVMQYESPEPKPPEEGALLSDQGIMNVAVGYRDRAEMADALAAAHSFGSQATAPPPAVSGGIYLRAEDRLSIELLLVPAGLDEDYGFVRQELAPPGSAYASPRAGRRKA